jgi:hypothetical protein
MSIQKWRKFMLGSLIAEEVSDKINYNQDLYQKNNERPFNPNKPNISH